LTELVSEGHKFDTHFFLCRLMEPFSMLSGIADAEMTLIFFFQLYLSLWTWQGAQASSAWRKWSARFEDHNPVALQFMVRLAFYTNSFRCFFQDVFIVSYKTGLRSCCSEQD